MSTSSKVAICLCLAFLAVALLSGIASLDLGAALAEALF